MPYEVAVFGENGAPGFTGSLNFRCENATATGSNSGLLVSPWFTSSPMQPAGLTVSSWKIGSAPQMVEHDHGTVNFTYYQTNQGFGAFGVARLIPTGVQTGGGPGFSYAPKSVHAFLHHGLAAEPAARPLDPHAVQAAAVVAPEMNA
jgi:hypothetical protein